MTIELDAQRRPRPAVLLREAGTAYRSALQTLGQAVKVVTLSLPTNTAPKAVDGTTGQAQRL